MKTSTSYKKLGDKPAQEEPKTFKDYLKVLAKKYITDKAALGQAYNQIGLIPDTERENLNMADKPVQDIATYLESLDRKTKESVATDIINAIKDDGQISTGEGVGLFMKYPGKALKAKSLYNSLKRYAKEHNKEL